MWATFKKLTLPPSNQAPSEILKFLDVRLIGSLKWTLWGRGQSSSINCGQELESRQVKQHVLASLDPQSSFRYKFTPI